MNNVFWRKRQVTQLLTKARKNGINYLQLPREATLLMLNVKPQGLIGLAKEVKKFDLGSAE